MTKVATIIPTLAHANTDYLELCVNSLRDSGFEGQIIVSSNGSKVKPDYRHIEGISTHIHTRDQGQGIAVNRGAQLVDANTDYLLISNDDMYYAPSWDKNVRYDYPVFSPNLVEPANNAGSAPPFLKRDWGVNLEEFKQERADQGIRNALQAIKFKSNAFDEPVNKEETGFNFPVFIRYDVWRTIEGYDEAYDPWGSNGDTDLQTKINLAGITPMRLRDVLVYHFSNKSGTFDGTHQAEWQHNWDYFTNKWGFNRDTVPGSDVWYNKNILPESYDEVKYHPDWEMKYEED